MTSLQCISNYLELNISKSSVCNGVGSCAGATAEALANKVPGEPVYGQYCECPYLYDAESNCTTTIFEYNNDGGVAANIIGILILLPLFAAFIWEIVYDVVLKRAVISSKKPLFLSKLFAFTFIICRIFIRVAYSVNYSIGHFEVQAPLAMEVVFYLGYIFFALAYSCVIATWLEVVEKVRKLKVQAKKTYQKLRLALILVFFIVAILVIIAIIAAQLSVDLRGALLPGVNFSFVILATSLMIISLAAIIRSAVAWKIAGNGATVRIFRVRTYLLSAITVTCFLYVLGGAISALSPYLTRGNFLGILICYNVVIEFLIALELLIFLQTHTMNRLCGGTFDYTNTTVTQGGSSAMSAGKSGKSATKSKGTNSQTSANLADSPTASKATATTSHGTRDSSSMGELDSKVEES